MNSPVLCYCESDRVGIFTCGRTSRKNTMRMAAKVHSCSSAAWRIMMIQKSPIISWDPSSSLAAVGAMPNFCGRGDRKTKKGKRFIWSFGNPRPKKEKKIERVKDRVEVPRSTPWPMPFKLI